MSEKQTTNIIEVISYQFDDGEKCSTSIPVDLKMKRIELKHYRKILSRKHNDYLIYFVRKEKIMKKIL